MGKFKRNAERVVSVILCILFLSSQTCFAFAKYNSLVSNMGGEVIEEAPPRAYQGPYQYQDPNQSLVNARNDVLATMGGQIGQRPSTPSQSQAIAMAGMLIQPETTSQGSSANNKGEDIEASLRADLGGLIGPKSGVGQPIPAAEQVGEAATTESGQPTGTYEPPLPPDQQAPIYLPDSGEVIIPFPDGGSVTIPAPDPIYIPPLPTPDMPATPPLPPLEPTPNPLDPAYPDYQPAIGDVGDTAPIAEQPIETVTTSTTETGDNLATQPTSPSVVETETPSVPPVTPIVTPTGTADNSSQAPVTPPAAPVASVTPPPDPVTPVAPSAAPVAPSTTPATPPTPGNNSTTLDQIRALLEIAQNNFHQAQTAYGQAQAEWGRLSNQKTMYQEQSLQCTIQILNIDSQIACMSAMPATDPCSAAYRAGWIVSLTIQKAVLEASRAIARANAAAIDPLIPPAIQNCRTTLAALDSARIAYDCLEEEYYRLVSNQHE